MALIFEYYIVAMNKYYSIIFFILIFFPLAAQRGFDQQTQNQLDEAIRNSSLYIKEKEDKLQTLKSKENNQLNSEDNYLLFKDLASEYRPFKSDSALFYAKQALNTANALKSSFLIAESQLTLASIYNTNGMYKESYEILSSLHSKDLPEPLKVFYYGVSAELYRYMDAFASDKELRSFYNKQRILYQDSLLQISDPADLNTKLVKADRMVDQGRIDEAILLLTNIQQEMTPSDRNYALTSNALSKAYKKLGNLTKEKEALALSAISDIKNAVKENTSLGTLALQLYKEGHLDEAYNYIRFALDDALVSDSKLRSIEILRILPEIDKAYKEQSEADKRKLMVFFIIVSVLSVFLLASFFYILLQKKKLVSANQKIFDFNEELKKLNADLIIKNSEVSEVNTKLSQLNHIQGGYIAKYLKLCSVYIGKMDDFRRSLLRKASAENTKELIQILKSKEWLDDELKAFYNDFDRAFLDLYPNFVDSFNNLLADDEKIEIKQGELLNTELRIFALIRLGITESSQIADFLRYSVTTIYNYRTKMRNRSKGPREEFEKEVMLLQ
ncbi:MAG: DUF6377 domain-containing protein [Bacteroidales bacterium]